MTLSPQTHANRAFARRRVKAAAGDHEPSRRAPAAGNHTFATANQTLTKVDARLTEVDTTLTKVDAMLTKVDKTCHCQPASSTPSPAKHAKIANPPAKIPSASTPRCQPLSSHPQPGAGAPPNHPRTNPNKPEQT